MAVRARLFRRLLFPVREMLAGVRRLATMLRGRRLGASIGHLDDRLLRDIGLTRHDFVSARAEPLFRESALALVGPASKAQAAPRTAARERRALAELGRAWIDEERTA